MLGLYAELARFNLASAQYEAARQYIKSKEEMAAQEMAYRIVSGATGAQEFAYLPDDPSVTIMIASELK